MLNRLMLTSNAYFYKVLRPISKAKIIKMQEAAAAMKLGKYVVREVRTARTVAGLNFELSLVIFRQETLPPFLQPGMERELKYCYMLLLEFDQFLVISKSGASECIDLVEDRVDTLSYQEISEYKINSTTKFEKLSVSNLDTAPGAMRRSSYEALDVKESLSTVSAGNKMVTSLKVKNQGQRSTMSPSTSRINDLGRRQSLDYFCTWAATQCTSLNKYKHKANYLDNFAEPLDFKTHVGKLRVKSVLFNFSGILDEFEDGSIVGIDYLDSNGRARDVNLSRLSETHDFCLDVNYDKTSKKHWIENKMDNTLQLKILKNGFRIHSDKLERIRVHYITGEIFSLIQLINKENLYILSFNSADIRYSQKTLFRDSRLLKNFPHFLKAFETDIIFQVAASEKGSCVAASAAFDKNCLFEIVESQFAGDCDYLFCDDLGDEWADYIGFKREGFIRFYHAKYSTKGFSASAFHDLVSQAAKNIGNFNFDQSLNTKSKKVAEFYSTTRITRLRKGSNATSS